MSRLNAAKVKAIKEPGRYSDGGTLFLYVAPGGSKSWVQRLVVYGKRRDIGLGGFPLTSLAEAREKAFANRKLARDGGDPMAAKRRAKVPTFREAAEKTFEANRPRWKNEKHVKNWIQSMEKYAFPVLWDIPVDQIGREEVLRILTPIWTSRPERARRLRQRIRTVLGWCQAHNYCEHNPAGEGISAALPSVPTGKAHFRALLYAEVPRALEIIEASRASMAAKLALRFLVLTAARSGEVRAATWGEIDIEGRTWTIPGERMKGGKEHRVPLSDEAAKVHERARALDDGSGLVFPSPVRKGKPLSDMSLTKVLRDTGLAEKTVVHGFRTAFRTWASEKTNADHAVMELSLAHAVGSAVERSYARSDLFAKRARLMESWGAFVCGGTGAKVVKLHG